MTKYEYYNNLLYLFGDLYSHTRWVGWQAKAYEVLQKFNKMSIEEAESEYNHNETIKEVVNGCVSRS